MLQQLIALLHLNLPDLVTCNSVLNKGSLPYLHGGSQQLPDFPSRTEQKLSSKNITAKMVSNAIYLMHPKPLAQTEFQPLFLRCVLQSFLLFLLSYTINAWPDLVFLPVGNLHRLCQFLKMMDERSDPGKYLSAFLLLLVRSLSLLLIIV